jgi:MoxR-like ATPase
MKELSLLATLQLNAALAKLGQRTPPSKEVAIKILSDMIDSGVTTLDQVRTLATTGNAPSTVIVDEIGGVQNVVRSSLVPVTDAIKTLSELSSNTHSQLQKIFTDVTDLRSDLTAKSKVKVDYKKINGEIRSAVADLFAEFKESHQFSEVAPEVAKAFPKTRKVIADELFDGALIYSDGEGNEVSFGGFEVEVWDDPAAPIIVDDYVFDPAALHQTLIALSDPLPHNTWLGGERGTGKTEFVTQVAARLGRRLFRINFDEGMSRDEFVGSNTIENGNVVWKEGTLSQAIQYAGAIILLDEVGFARSQNINALHAVTERSPHRALLVAETGASIKVAPSVVFFAADNSIGHGDDSGNFVGVREQNSAFLDRFSYTLRFEYLPADKEALLIHGRTGLDMQATELLVAFANTARSKARAGILTQPPSLRQLFAWASAIQAGLPVSVAFTNAIVNKFPIDCESELRGIYAAVIDSAKLKSYLGRS